MYGAHIKYVQGPWNISALQNIISGAMQNVCGFFIQSDRHPCKTQTRFPMEQTILNLHCREEMSRWRTFPYKPHGTVDAISWRKIVKSLEISSVDLRKTQMSIFLPHLVLFYFFYLMFPCWRWHWWKSGISNTIYTTMEPTASRNYWSDNRSNRRSYLVKPGKVPGLPGFFQSNWEWPRKNYLQNVCHSQLGLAGSFIPFYQTMADILACNFMPFHQQS